MSVKATANHHLFPLWNIDLEMVCDDKKIPSMKLSSHEYDHQVKFVGNKMTPDAEVIEALMKFSGVGPNRTDSSIDYRDLISNIYKIRFTSPVKIAVEDKYFDCSSVGRLMKNIVRHFSRESIKYEQGFVKHDFDTDRIEFLTEGELIRVVYHGA